MAAQGLASQVGVAPACRALGVSRATFYRRHKVTPGHQQPRPTPARALCDSEREHVLNVLASPRFVDRAPAEVVATLLDEGQYLCSERTMYRILAANQPVREPRGGARARWASRSRAAPPCRAHRPRAGAPHAGSPADLSAFVRIRCRACVLLAVYREGVGSPPCPCSHPQGGHAGGLVAGRGRRRPHGPSARAGVSGGLNGAGPRRCASRAPRGRRRAGRR